MKLPFSLGAPFRWACILLVAVFSLSLSFLVIYVSLFDYQEDLRSFLERRTRALTGRAVSMGQFVVDIPNFSFAIRDLAVPPSNPGPPVLHVDVLSGQIDLLTLFTGRLHLASLNVDGVRVHVRDYGKGEVDIGLSREGGLDAGKGSARLALSAEHLLIENGTFVYDNRSVPWRLEANRLSLSLSRAPLAGYRGRVSFDQGSFGVKEHSPAPASLAARFEVRDREIQVSELTASGPFYALRSQGTLYLTPKATAQGNPSRAQFVFEAEADVGPAARALFGFSHLEGSPYRRGRARGSLSAGRGWHEMRAAVEVPVARFARIPASNWSGEVYWDRSLLSVRSARGLLAGGPATLRVRQELPASSHRALLEAEFQDASLSAAMEGITGDPGHVASRLKGWVRVDLKAGEADRLNGRWQIAGDYPEEAETPAGQAPLRLFAAGSFREGDLELARTTLATDTLSVQLEGKYPRRASVALALEAEAREIAEIDRLQRVVRTLLHPERPARLLDMAGPGRATGVIEGRLPNLSFRGRATSANLNFRGIRWGATQAEGSLSAREIRFSRLSARKDLGRLEASGQVSFGPEPFWRRAFELRGTVERWPADDLERVLGRELGLVGWLTGEGSFSRRGETSLLGRASYTLVDAAIRGQPFALGSGRVELDGSELNLSPIAIADGTASVEGSLFARLDGSSLRGRFQGQRLSLTRLPLAAGKLEGLADLRVEVGGTSAEPELSIAGSSSELKLAGASVGAASLSAWLRGGKLSGNLSTSSGKSRLMASGEKLLSAGGAGNLSVRWTDLELGDLLRALRPNLPASLSLSSSGEASLASLPGEPGGTASLSGQARVQSLAIQLADYRMSSLAPFSLSLAGERLSLRPLRLEGEDTRLDLEGSVNLDGTDLDVNALGAVNPELAGSFLPNLAAAGRAEIVARLRGSLDEPLLAGHAELDRGSLRLKAFPQGLAELKGRFEFDNRMVHFERVTCRFGGAPTELSGRVFLAGLLPESFEVRGEGKGLRLRYPEGLVATVDADLLLSGTLKEQLLSGRIDIRDALWSREYDVTTEILTARERQTAETEPGPLANLRFDIQVVAPGSLRVRNSVAEIDAAGEVQLRGTYPRPALLGRTEASRGELFFMGNRYRLLSGRIDFVDPQTVRPLFDIVAETRVRSYRVELRLAGTAERFHPELSSDPPLRTVDILRLLAGGSERDILLGTEEEEIAGVGVAGLLTGRLTHEIGRRAERLFGLDRFSINPFLVGQIANPTARVTLGKRISRDVTVSYSTNLNSTTESIILIEYDPGGAATWIVSRDETGAFGIDVKFRKRF